MISLNSPLSVGSGDGIAGVVDQEITHEHGIPIIPAKRLKGALRGVAKEFVDWNFAKQEDVDSLFGQAGQAEMSGFKLFDANLYQLPKNYFGNESHEIKDYNTFIGAVQEHSERELLKLFTMLYTKTAVSGGTAETGSLRTIRVINKGLVFKSVVELENEADFKLLQNCVKGLRRLGMGRARGLGEITCQLNQVIEQEPREIQEVAGKKAFKITLQQPTLLAGEKGLYYSCINYIPGSALLGVFAGLYIKKYQLKNQAHLDEDFARIFLREGVKFGYAYPEVNQNRYLPCPAHIQRVKNKNQAQYEGMRDEENPLRKISALAYKEGKNLLLHEPQQEFRMHHARPEDRQFGRAINDTKTVQNISGEKGQFYYYTALQKGQQFVGELQGNQEDIELLLSLLNEKNGEIQLGRSRTAEYGAAKVEIVDELPKISFEPANEFDKTVAIYLATPLTVQNAKGRYVADVDLLVEQFEYALGASLTVEKLYLQQTILTGYNAKWRLPKPEREAFNAGTVLIVSTEEKVDWSLLTDKRWGEETSQGCGEIYVLKQPTAEEFEICSVEKVMAGSNPTSLKELYTYIDDEIAKAQEKRRIQVVAEKLAEAKKSDFDAYSNSKLYKLEQCALEKKDLKLPEENKVELEKEAKELRRTAKQELKDNMKEDKELINHFIKSYFHMIKLEVRKNVHG